MLCEKESLYNCEKYQKASANAVRAGCHESKYFAVLNFSAFVRTILPYDWPVKPLPRMQILGSPNSAANKDIM